MAVSVKVLLRYQNVLLISSHLICFTHIQLPTTRAKLVKKPIHLASHPFSFGPKFSSINSSPRLPSNQPGTNGSTVQLPGGLFRVIPCAETCLFLIVPAPHLPHRAFGFAEVEKVLRLSKAVLQLRSRFSATCGLRYWRFGRLVRR